MPGGRPTNYRPEFCEMLIEHMKQGFSFESFGAIAHCSKDTLFRWASEYQEFSDSKKIGAEYSRQFWEKLGVAGAAGKLKGFSAATWIFNMKNRHNWSDRMAVEHNTGKDAKLVIDLSSLREEKE